MQVLKSAGIFYYKVGKVLKSGATFITKWGNYYKLGQDLNFFREI